MLHAEYTFEPLAKAHARNEFRCGVEALDVYLQRLALQDRRRNLAVPWVCTPDGRRIAAYFTLSNASIQLSELPEDLARRLPRYPQVPATLIGRLAVDQEFQREHAGELTLLHALRLAVIGGRSIAAAGVIVDAKDQIAVSFYQHFNFIRLTERRLFLPIHQAEDMTSDLKRFPRPTRPH